MDTMHETARKWLKWLAVACLWLLVWQLASMALANQVLLASPAEVARTLAADIVTAAFWGTVAFSFFRIAAGFTCAFAAGLLLGGLSSRLPLLRDVLQLLVSCIKSIPVVCIIVLLLIWTGSRWVSMVAVALVVFPAIYFATMEALANIDPKMREMLGVFRVPRARRILFCYWPSMLPFISATCKVTVGMSWKSGIAAEIIGIPLGSIGEQLYMSKITLETADLLAWTVTIVLASLVCEKAFLALLHASAGWGRHLALPLDAGGAAAPVGLGSSLDSNSPSQGNVGAGCPAGRGVAVLAGSHISKSFGGNGVIDSLDFEICAGERWRVAGPSGEGKTTLLRMMAGLEDPDAGQLSSTGSISMVFQEARLFEDASAVDNIALVVGKHMRRDDIRGLLCNLLPTESIDLPVSELSGGMRRRVELVRALAMPSDVVILDEPFSGLDAVSQAQASGFVDCMLGGRALIIATHDDMDAERLGTQTLELRV